MSTRLNGRPRRRPGDRAAARGLVPVQFGGVLGPRAPISDYDLGYTREPQVRLSRTGLQYGSINKPLCISLGPLYPTRILMRPIEP